MPISFACTCGKQFRVGDELAGKKTRCPACQQPLVVPIPEPEPAAPPTMTDSVSFSCSCGKSLRAKLALCGKKTRCPGCGAALEIPLPPPAVEEETEPEADYEPYEEEEPDTASSEGDEERHEDGEAAAQPAFEPFERVEPPPRPRPRERLEDRYKDLVPDKPAPGLHDYLYWGLLFFLIPLALSLVIWDEEATLERFYRTIENAPEEVQERIFAIRARIEERREAERQKNLRGLDSDDDEEAGLTDSEWDEIVSALPGGRIEGAHLPRKTIVHWFYAAGAIGMFLGVALFLFPQGGQPLHLFLIGLFTGTIGIVLLLGVQLIAGSLQGLGPPRGHFVYIAIYWVIFMIGFSYRAALDPERGFVTSLLGYTFGVGLCEEVCKALPLLWYYRRRGLIGWREACTWGFASGAGFGVAEGIIYAADFYNGHAGVGIYLVRFVSCVALHAIWTASVALFIYRFQYFLQEEMEWHDWPVRVLFMVSVPMILHGLYDTFLKKEMNGWALVTALVSFGWLAWRVEVARHLEADEESATARKKRKPRLA
ncbi:MAG: PrsW family glutamic-type intramembrane protease [Gemmataceae bacterium]